jgi:hypothetical protein
MSEILQKTWTFAKLEAALAQWHSIHSTKRTAFQARLKNFLRLGFPPMLESTKGKATEFNAWSAYCLAVALEMTQLGMPPDRTIRALRPNHYAMAMAGKMAAEAVIDMIAGSKGKGEYLRMYLYFDPEALGALTLDEDDGFDQAEQTFFYGGHGVMADMLKSADYSEIRRLALINVTSLVASLTGTLGRKFLNEIMEQADTISIKGVADGSS